MSRPERPGMPTTPKSPGRGSATVALLGHVLEACVEKCALLGVVRGRAVSARMPGPETAATFSDLDVADADRALADPFVSVVGLTVAAPAARVGVGHDASVVGRAAVSACAVASWAARSSCNSRGLAASVTPGQCAARSPMLGANP